MKIILLKQFYTDITEGNKIYLYYKMMKKSFIIFIFYLKYTDIFNKIVKMIFLLH